MAPKRKGWTFSFSWVNAGTTKPVTSPARASSTCVFIASSQCFGWGSSPDDLLLQECQTPRANVVFWTIRGTPQNEIFWVAISQADIWPAVIGHGALNAAGGFANADQTIDTAHVTLVGPDGFCLC